MSSIKAAVPSGWRLSKLRNLTWVNPEQIGGCTDPNYLLEYLDIAAIERPSIIGRSQAFRFADAPSRARRLARDGDILVSTVRPYLRNFARIRKAPDNLVVSTGYAVIRPRDGVDGSFLYQHILSANFVEFLKRRMSGSNYPAVKASDVEAYPLPLPPLAQQRKVGAILCSVDDAIKKTRAVIDQMQVVKRGLMHELLTRAALTHGHVATLGDVASVNPEQLSSRTAPEYLLEYLDIAAIERTGAIGRSRAFRFADAPSRARRLAREGDILISTVRPYLRNFARIRKGPDNLIVSTGYAVVRPKESVDGDFLYQHILSAGFVEFLKPRMSGSNYPAVTARDVEAYPVVLPPLAQQRKIGAILSSLDDAIDKARAVVDQECAVQRALMSILLTGELRVALDSEAV